MTTNPPIDPAFEWEDPRARTDFVPQCYPQANGRDAPPAEAADPNDRVMLQFLAAYYELNRAYARLLEVRNTTDTPQRQKAEREQLQAMEKVLIVRDTLEDHYAPAGVIAEPVVQDGFAVNVQFSFGNKDAAGRKRTDRYRLTAYVPIPLPVGMDINDLPYKIEGPGIEPE